MKLIKLDEHMIDCHFISTGRALKKVGDTNPFGGGGKKGK